MVFLILVGALTAISHIIDHIAVANAFIFLLFFCCTYYLLAELYNLVHYIRCWPG